MEGKGVKVRKAIHLKEAQLFLDECKRTRERVNLTVLTKKGELVKLEGWIVLSSWWTRGTHDLMNPANRIVRKVRDILIFDINGHPVYI